MEEPGVKGLGWSWSMSGFLPSAIPRLVSLDRLLTHLEVKSPHLQNSTLCSSIDALHSSIKT